jgi:hypothetical protein
LRIDEREVAALFDQVIGTLANAPLASPLS